MTCDVGKFPCSPALVSPPVAQGLFTPVPWGSQKALEECPGLGLPSGEVRSVCAPTLNGWGPLEHFRRPPKDSQLDGVRAGKSHVHIPGLVGNRRASETVTKPEARCVWSCALQPTASATPRRLKTMFRAALFIRAPNRKLFQNPSAGKWLNKL